MTKTCPLTYTIGMVILYILTAFVPIMLGYWLLAWLMGLQRPLNKLLLLAGFHCIAVGVSIAVGEGVSSADQRNFESPAMQFYWALCLIGIALHCVLFVRLCSIGDKPRTDQPPNRPVSG